MFDLRTIIDNTPQARDQKDIKNIEKYLMSSLKYRYRS